MTEFAYRKQLQIKSALDVVKKRVLVIYTGGTIGMKQSEIGKLGRNRPGQLYIFMRVFQTERLASPQVWSRPLLEILCASFPC